MLKWFASLLGLGVGTILLVHGTGEPGIREVIRWTARSSLCLICHAMAADRVTGAFVGWRHWTEALRSLSLSHGVHGVAVAALAFHTGGRNLLERSSPIDVLGGALAYVFIFWGAFRPHSRLASA